MTAPPTPTLHVLTHIWAADIAWIERAALRRGLAVVIVSPATGRPLPEPAHVERAIVLGGPMSADDVAAHPFLSDERGWLRTLVTNDTPVLGICLGSQLLAIALDGRVEPGKHGPEVGYIDIMGVPGGNHPLAEALPGRHFSFHTDVSLPPEGAELLARSDRYPQAWSLGSALALQFHPELSPAGVSHLVAHEGPNLTEIGLDGKDLIAASRKHEPTGTAKAEQILGGWLDLTPPQPITPGRGSRRTHR